MKIKLDKEKLNELINEYYEETRYKIKNIEIGVEKWRNKNGMGYRPRVDIERRLKSELVFGEAEETLYETDIVEIIKTQLSKKDYEVENIKFNCGEDEFGIIEVTVNEKNKGEMNVKNLKMYEGCLIVVDMVNGFVREGVLHDPNIAKIIPRQIELIKEAKNAGKLIVFIKDTHEENAVEFERFGNTKHCVKGNFEADVVDELKEYEKDGIAIPKNSTCFMEAPLFRKLMEREINMNEFDIVGCCTDICVVNGAIALANYLDQNNRKHVIRVHEDAIATYNEDNRKEYVDAAKLLMQQQGIQLVKKGR